MGCRPSEVPGTNTDQFKPTRLELEPAAASVAVNGTLLLTATPRTADGRVVLGGTITWTSARSDIASVTSSGVVTGIAVGIDTVTASSDGIQGRAVIIVGAGRASEAVFSVNTSVTHPISRFIYGLNFLIGAWDDATPPAGITLSRIGGNRMTAYNWENNYSNAGSDYYFQNDNFMS
ncbi:MAG: Ig-like domain-containing protein, partial [Gemmatimonadaceae bacterium]